MFTSVSSLINGDKISYDCLEEMINSGAVKNLFTKTGSGEFKKIGNKKELEDMFLRNYSQEMKIAKSSVIWARDNLKIAMKRYQAIYKNIKEKYTRYGYEPAEIVKMSVEDLKKKLDDDAFDHKLRLEDLKKYNMELKQTDAKIKAKKKSYMYYGLYFYSYEYEKAKYEYVKKILENIQAENKGGKDDNLPF